MTLALVLAGAVLAALSGLAAVALRRAPARAQRAACGALVAGAALGLAGALLTLGLGGAATLALPWRAPFAALAFRLDALSALFLLPVFGVPAAGACFGLAYWPQATRGGEALRLQGFYGLVTGAMAVLMVADNAMLFLSAWEVMALCGFLLVLTEHGRREVQRAAFVYLTSAHVATLALFALFSALGHAAGGLDFARIAGAGLAPAGGLFALALLGFGLKAGLVPLHFWLPGAHAAAPSHVSAVMSGVLLKTGVYGLLRVTSWFPSPPASWGLSLLALGAASAVLGVAFALAQHDLKRLLAYHSVENVGIIAMGAGLALLGRAAGDPALVLLGLAGAALHVVNHALFKALLFLGAGAVDHAAGTRELDRLGGLARAMPITAGLFLLGAAAISGLPPLNGFVSEWLVYLGALRAGAAGASRVAAAVLAAPLLALTGGLAAACFAKVHGVVFLGQPRSAAGAAAHEAARPMLAAMAALAGACALVGLAPALALPGLRRAAEAWARLPEGALAGPAREAGAAGGALALSGTALLLLGAAWAALAWRRRRAAAAAAPRAETWGCGYARPTARMQYTGASFADLLTRHFGWAFFPRARVEAPRGVFPAGASFDSHVPDTVLDVALLPAAAVAGSFAERLRRLHTVQVQGQALLVFATLLGLLSWRFIWW